MPASPSLGFLRRAAAPLGALVATLVAACSPLALVNGLTSVLLRSVFGYPETSPTTQPINFVVAGGPRALLVVAAHDRIVDPGNSARLAARIRAAGGTVREVSYDQLDHRTVIGALAAPLRGLAPVLDDVAAFVAAPTR